MKRMENLPPDCRNSNFAETDFAFLDVSGTDFSGSDLTGARFWGSQIDHCNFDNTVAKYLNCAATIDESTCARGASFKFADLTGARLSGAYLKDADLTGACLEGADLRSAFLEGVVSHGITGTPLHLPTGWELDESGTLMKTGESEDYGWWIPGS